MKVQKLMSTTLLAALALGPVMAWASNPELESHKPSQAAADVFRQLTGADMAFLPAGLVKSVDAVTDLSQLMVYPTDTLSVVKLTGAQVRLALERSVSLAPLPSSAFLQLSGLTVTYSKSAAPDKRIISVQVGDSKLSDSATYQVAMPTTLARGGLGYFKVWDKSKIDRTLEGQSLESILTGKRPTESADRWIAN